MDISFIIITNGKKPQELSAQVNSILGLSITNYEIIIIGEVSNLKYDSLKIKLIKDSESASRGSLGALRNNACKLAIYENLVISDDDMLFTKDWYQNLLKAPSFQILTTCIRNPDGTRFWDNACYMSPIHGHVNLNYNEEDDYKYMSGGQSWLIKKSVWEQVKWDEDLLIYKMKNLEDYSKGLHNEDTDFALRCREKGFKITHYPEVIVYHNDATYTGIGRMVRRRSVQKDESWALSFNFPEKISLEFAINLINYGLHAEGADLLRKIASEGSLIGQQALKQFEDQLGGILENSQFTFDNIEYKDLIKLYGV
jgi:GT2 family glycosyltransferase